MLMTPNYSYLFPRHLFPPQSHSFSLWSTKSLNGCHLTSFKTASTIATSIVHSKLDYCNSLFLSLDSTQIHRLQLIQNSLARAVTRTPRHHHITPVLKSLHWLKIREHIHFKVLSLTYSSLQSSQPTYLHELFTIHQHALLDHHPLSPFLDPRSLLISCFPTICATSHVFQP